MTETALAAGDLITAIPSLWQALQVPLAIIAICVGGVAGAFSLARGFGAAAGKVLGGIAIAAIILGGVGLAVSLKGTVDKHGGGITSGQFG
ncbi:hypothetical protein [Mycobacterium sp. IDR2000157661]|uniref:hypothetical protein n=1 Tax=Mycobacterium sp. IDR2000157661 TaxID=2867005 RepID=UPI001EEAE7D0|nr:hypothetical protein [Mycobacterium sp. IDR2000157661]ULE31179.1 hypothetical protein K3G64_00390 [Mycobacterium sp. IDR2000157661]